MRLLLDTHIFLWFINGDKRLPELLRASIETTDNDVFLSAVSSWEIAIKYQIGKLQLPENPATYIPRLRREHYIFSLPLSEAGIAQLDNLPPHHRDPFDRMLICQAIAHDLLLVSLDPVIASYPVKLLK